MGTLGTCCCGCCLEEAEMPYSTVTLKAPYYACGEGEPSYPTEIFSALNCCYQAVFRLENLGQCPPETFNCYLWAKREVNISYSAEYYNALIDYITTLPPAEPPPVPSDFDCPCTLVQTKDVSIEGTSRAFLLQGYRLDKITITVGKAKVKCDEDESPVCRYFIASSWEFIVTEDIPFPSHYYKKTISCTGNFLNGDCSITNSWIEESGTDSDVCPYDDFVRFPVDSTVTISRVKFYDTLPDPGEITITGDDDEPFNCCSGKTNCEITEPTCGIEVGSNCIPNAPTYDEWLNVISIGQAQGPFNLVPCGEYLFQTSMLIYDWDTEAWLCLQVCENGYMPAGITYTDVYYCDPESSGCCTLYGLCEVTTIGWDSFGNPLGTCPTHGPGAEGMEGFSPCGTLDVDYVNDIWPSPPASPSCLGGANPPEPGLCTTGECCSYEDNGFQIEFNCLYLGPSCGRKIVDFTCTHNRTDYTVGGLCIPIPSVTIELFE